MVSGGEVAITWLEGDGKALIATHLAQSAMYGGAISSQGPRYCPSIEDKVVRFADKASHQVFIEPEGLDTHEVLAAAGTKWNFLGFRPGLVGGHCIGVDPYYLTHRAEKAGCHPEIILAGRRTNDDVGARIARECLRKLFAAGCSRPSVAVLGLTFKENVPDLRNSKGVQVKVKGMAPDRYVLTCNGVPVPLQNTGTNATGQSSVVADADVDATDGWDTATGDGMVVVRHPELQQVIEMTEAFAPVSFTASATVLNTAIPSCLVPPLPGVTPPTILVP